MMMQISQNPMVDNYKKERLGVVTAQLDVENCLPEQTTHNNNSWFAFGRYQMENCVLDFLFHIQQLQFPRLLGGKKYQSVVTVFNETTGEYYAKDYLFKAEKTVSDTERFFLKMPNGTMEGNWNHMHICIDEKTADLHLDVCTTAVHYPVVTCGTSVFELMGMCIHQFSVPYMKTKGSMIWKGNTYDLTDKGYVWFDRQWQFVDMRKPMKWSWMAIYLDNGDIISVLDCDVPGYETGLFSNLCVDGTQINSMGHEAVVPFKNGESEYYYNENSKQEYPTHWHIDIPKIDTKLEVKPFKKEQDIASVLKPLSKYEGVCNVSGTYKGMKVQGTALVELVGSWPKRN